MEQSVQTAGAARGTNPLEMLQSLMGAKTSSSNACNGETTNGEEGLVPFLEILNQQMGLLSANGEVNVQQMMGLNEQMQEMFLAHGGLPAAESDPLLELKSLWAKLFPASELSDLDLNALIIGGKNISEVITVNVLSKDQMEGNEANTDEISEQLKSAIMGMIGGMNSSGSKETQDSADAVSNKTKTSTLAPDIDGKSYIKEATVNAESNGKKETVSADVLKYGDVVRSLKENQQNIKLPEMGANQPRDPVNIALTDNMETKDTVDLGRQDNTSQRNMVMSEVQIAADGAKKVMVDGEKKMNITESKDENSTQDISNKKSENSLFGKDVKSTTLIRENSVPSQKSLDIEPGKAESAKIKTAESMQNSVSEKTKMEHAKIETAKVNAATVTLNSVGDNVKTDSKVKITPVDKSPESSILTSVSGSNISVDQSDTAGKTAPTEIISRIASEIKENLLSDGGRIKITLTPPSLGTLEMDVVIRNGKVEVILIADNKDVQKILAGNIEQLKGSLQTQGLTIERCDVMMQDRREQYHQGFSQQAFNQEQSAKHHNDSGEAYNQDDEKSTSLKIKPMNHATMDSGKISLFA